MPLTLDEVITRVPEWKDAKELKSIPLGGGITYYDNYARSS
jgi:hypothetical protein